MAALDQDRIRQYRGQQIDDVDGEKIGSIEEIYLDAETEAPEWALVRTGLFGTKSTFVPLRDAGERDGNLRVAFAKATVKDAPNMDLPARGGRALPLLRHRVLRRALRHGPARGRRRDGSDRPGPRGR